MSHITPQLDAIFQGFTKNAPETIQTPINAARAELINFDTSETIKIGDKLPSFSLQNALGELQTSTTLLNKGFQKHLSAFTAKNVTLVAITPELPNGTLSMTEKHELEFPVLTDLHNAYARKLGIVWRQPESLRPVFETFGHDLPRRNGDDSFELPLPATMLVDGEGVVRNLYLEPDYVKRVEPLTVLDWIDEL